MNDTAKDIDLDLLRQFGRIGTLPARILDYVAGQTELEHFAPDTLIAQAGRSDGKIRLLIKGSINLTDANQVAHKISAGGRHGKIPISGRLPKDSRINTLDTVTTYVMPEDLFLSIEHLPAQLGQTDHTAGIPDSGDGSMEVLYRLQDALQRHDLKMPSMPGIAPRIAKVVNNPNTDSHDIAKVIQADPSVAGRIISVVNSAAYRGSSPIDNLPDAVSRLGRNTTHNLVVSFALSGLFYTHSTNLKKYMADAWRHTSMVAAICHELARVTPGLAPDNAMLCGLVHNIGILPIINAAQSHKELAEDPQLLAMVISKMKGEIGALVLKEWDFSPVYIEACQYAEDWMQDIHDKPSYLDLVIVAKLHAHISTPKMRELPRLDLVPSFHKLALGKLTPRHSIGIIENAKESIESLKTLLAGSG